MKKVLTVFTILLLVCMTGTIFAADDFSFAASRFNEGTKSLELIVNDNRDTGDPVDAASLFIGEDSLTDISFANFNETDIPITFCFVTDVSTTYVEGQQQMPVDLAVAVSEFRGSQKDEYVLFRFNEDVYGPTGPSRYPKNVFEDMGYNKSTKSDYSQALEKAVEYLDNLDTFSKKVIILVTDGRQTQTPKRAASDLEYYLENAGYPVFIYGLRQQESQRFEKDDLGKLEQISKITGGLFVSGEVSSVTNAAAEFTGKMFHTLSIAGTLPEAFQQNEAGLADVRLVLNNGEDVISQLETSLNLPVIEMAVEPEAAEPESEPSINESQTIIDRLKDSLGDNWLLILIAAGLLIALIILIILILVKPQKQETPIEVIPIEDQDNNVSYNVEIFDQNHKKLCSLEIQEGETRVFGRKQPADKKIRDVIELTADGHISRKHFMISVNDAEIYIEDMGSENGTWLNGQKVRGKTPLTSGMVRIGDKPGEREFNVRVRKL